MSEFTEDSTSLEGRRVEKEDTSVGRGKSGWPSEHERRVPKKRGNAYLVNRTGSPGGRVSRRGERDRETIHTHTRNRERKEDPD